MEACGYTGFYLRVRTPGRLFAGAPIQLVLRPHPHLTIAEANRVMHHGAHDRAALQALLVPQLGASWRRTFERRLAGEVEDPTTRRHGPAQDEEHP
jgi:MOSC domain-containing protein YiiM